MRDSPRLCLAEGSAPLSIVDWRLQRTTSTAVRRPQTGWHGRHNGSSLATFLDCAMSMKLLFVHQNFPGQFKHLAPALVAAGHDVRAMGIGGTGLPEIPMVRYQVARGSTRDIHPLAAEFETKLIRADACAGAALRMKQAGYTPDLIVANPGWGESLFLKDVWPTSKLLILLEFFYATKSLDVNFDPEFPSNDIANAARVRVKNAHLLLTLDSMDWGISPTHFQHSTMPHAYRDRISVVFDGIDTQTVRPDAAATLTLSGKTLHAGDEVLTFVNRNLEPYRGYHRFMRALPRILRERPNATVLIVGGDDVSYGAKAPEGKTWKQIFLDEVAADIAPHAARVHFLGRIPYATYLNVLQVSRCHVYLTYPFVLGWSCIEAMSAGCLVIGSATAPVQEVIEHQKNGLLVDFFDRDALAGMVIGALAQPQPQRYAALRLAARATAVERYDLATVCLPQQLQLIERLATATV